MAHSIPDAVGDLHRDRRPAASSTPATGSSTTRPVDGLRTDVGKLAELGNRGVDLLLGDSTNAERPGFTRSERVVGEAFRQIIPQRHGRILDLLVRLEHPPDAAGDRRRASRSAARSASIGRSMRKNLNIARNLGYIEAPDDLLVRPAGSRRAPARAAADPLHRLAGRAALGADADRLQRPSRRARSSAATR